jgi:sorbitol/mannitol transport system substrate-binding protein
VAGKVGYVAAPVTQTASSGWLYSWAFAMQKASTKQAAAWKFISWASSKGYENLVGQQLGWAEVPAGKRASTYTNADYQKSAGPFYAQTEAAIQSADPKNPGTQPRPTVGIQFVDIPEFTDLGTQVSQEISAAIAGQESVTTALNKGQQLAATVAKKYQGK